MRIAFVDPAGLTYTVDTMLARPLGGSQTALCDLAKQLAKRGHDVTVLNKIAEPIVVAEVKHRSIACLDERLILNCFDVAIILNGVIGRWLRQKLGTLIPLILWCHHDYNQPAIFELSQPDEQAAWTQIVFAGYLQRQRVGTHYGIPTRMTTTLANCVPMPFINEVVTERHDPPRLVYLSTPYRGLDILLDVFPRIRELVPGTTLQVFSSMAPYQVGAAADATEFGKLYAQAKNIDGVAYMGSVGLTEMISRLQGVTALAHPSTFPEVQSIAALEVMAMGGAVLTTNLGGQREVTGDLGHLIPYEDDHKALGNSFVVMASRVLREMQADPERERRARAKRAAHVRDVANWTSRVLSWESNLENIISCL